MTWKWLESTLELQIKSYGNDPTTLEGDELADFVTWNVTALIAEMGEFLQEVKWKTWVTTRGMGNREAAIGELVDAAHFLANLASAMRCDDEEWERRYQEKQRRNAARQVAGYDGLKGKCPNCHRAFDDVGTMLTTQGVTVCAGCHYKVS